MQYWPLLIFTLLIGCSVSPAQLTSRSDNKTTWEVAAPIDVVFKRYKAERENEDGFAAIGASFNTSGFFYGDAAELTTKMQGMQIITCLHLKLSKTPRGALVESWHYTDMWKDAEDRLKALIPVVSQQAD